MILWTYYQRNPDGTFTAYYTELPGLIVQANSMDEADEKLSKLLSNYIQRITNDNRN